ncbi:efflux RND transporter permease subunit [Glaciecola sp. 1036]|uniref:efflux RND transporter permease subunit n=1 Tax=Alteromonadaceae TaxID=72275 RepID=UPI003CFC074E
MSSSSGKQHLISQTIAKFIVSDRIPIIILFAITFAALAYFSTQFKINASADTLLTKNNELYIETQLANEKFSPSEFILIAYQPRNHALFSEQTFQDLAQLTNQFEQIERLETTNSILNVPLISSATNLLQIDNVADLTYQKQQYSVEQMRNMLSEHPIYTDLLVNEQQDATSIQLVFKKNSELEALNAQMLDIQAQTLDGELSDEQQQTLDSLKQEASKIEEQIGKTRQQELAQIEQIIASTDADADIFIGGSYVVGLRLIEIVKQDLVYFGIGIAALICLLLAILYRSVKWVIFPILACGASITVTMGVLAILQIPATVISANFIALQLILTLAIMLHLITCYREISRDDESLTQKERVIATLTDKIAPCFFAAITTSIGFASLIFSGIQPVMDFGIMMLISNLVTLLVALLLFPAILSFLPATKEAHEYTWVKSLLNKVKSWVINHPAKTAIIPLAILIGLSVGISRLTVENSFINYFHQDTKIYQELSFIDRQFGGSTALDVVINLPNAQEGDLFLRAETINQLHLSHATIDAFEASGNVTSLINFTLLAKQVNQNMPLTEYELDVIYEVVDKEVIDQLLGAYVDTDSKTLRISTRIKDSLPDLNRQQLLDNIKADLAASGLEPEQYKLTNLFILYQDILSRLFDSQITTLGIVYIALGIVLLIIFRSLKLALIALVPNIITTTAILGLIGWLGIPLDLMTITIAAIAMGIAVDDTIHFMDAFITGQNQDKLSGLKSAFSHTGLAITYTTTLIALGFGMFMFSDFMPSVYFGLLTASAMLFALFCDLTVLPTLLQKFVVKPATDINEDEVAPAKA